jgi:hypothetical protein
MIVPDLDALATRLGEVKDRLAGTAFSCSVEDKHVSVTCPWGNRMRFYAPGPQFGDLTLGMLAVESPVPLGHAAGIARFYETVMQAPATVTPNGEGSVARVKVGPRQDLVFRETAAEIPAYDGHHIAIYITDFDATPPRSAGSSARRATSTSTASRTSWIPTRETCSSLSSTRSAATPIRCSCGRS